MSSLFSRSLCSVGSPAGRPGGAEPGRLGFNASLSLCQVSCLSHIAANYLMAGQEAKRWGTAHQSIVPYQVSVTHLWAELTAGQHPPTILSQETALLPSANTCFHTGSLDKFRPPPICPL